MEYGDTNFIGLVNAERYESFVDEDWELDGLLGHFAAEMKKGTILAGQMTEEGIEHSWRIEVRLGMELFIPDFVKKAEGYIRVTNERLYLVDYGCLTMAAQFEDENVPDENGAQNEIKLENGVYRVEITQFYDADRDEYRGTDETDLLVNLVKVPAFRQNPDGVFWCIYK
ncbi:hypothetical protein [Domibacillus indicus]|uniref:hypothetical protein n=1 Tax=Domibacillus indicus TaxID=1437523 RepID=UPI0018CF8854